MTQTLHEKIYETPLQVSTTSKGLHKFWVARVLRDSEGNIYTQTEAWQSLADGGESQHIVSVPKLIKGKNTGKANETTPEAQARFEVDSLTRKQQDKGYWNHGEAAPESRLPLPMLAHPFEKRKHDIDWRSAWAQPKLDGVRCLTDGTRFWSRQGKLFLPEVVKHLQVDLPEGTILDGELMLAHEEFTFQDTISAVKKWDSATSPKLLYFVYDVVDLEKPFEERLLLLMDLFDRPLGKPVDRMRFRDEGPMGGVVLPENFRPVLTVRVTSEEELKALHAEHVGAGYEGSMVRNGKGMYRLKDRSADLQKYKEFEDQEFPVVGFEEGEAKDQGTIIFWCRSPYHAGWKLTLPPLEVLQKLSPLQRREYGVFSVRPRGTHVQRSQWWRDRTNLLGSELTVRYQNLSDDGVPRFPVGIAVRSGPNGYE